MSRSKTVVNQESKRTTKAKIDVDLSANGIYKVYRSPMTCISHTNKTSPPGRRRRIYGVSRKTRTHISIIDHRYIFWIYTCYSFLSHFCSHTIGSFGFQHTDVVFNITHTVADGISNGNANGPFRNDFTSPVYLLCIIFLEVSTIFLFNYEKRK